MIVGNHTAVWIFPQSVRYPDIQIGAAMPKQHMSVLAIDRFVIETSTVCVIVVQTGNLVFIRGVPTVYRLY